MALSSRARRQLATIDTNTTMARQTDTRYSPRAPVHLWARSVQYETESIRTDAVREPAAVGLKLTITVQVPFTASTDPTWQVPVDRIV